MMNVKVMMKVKVMVKVLANVQYDEMMNDDR
jgi:hypothetical protein